MNLTSLWVAIACAAGIISAAPKRAAIMAAAVGFVVGSITTVTEHGFGSYGSLYSLLIFPLLLGVVAAVIAFVTSKLNQ